MLSAEEIIGFSRSHFNFKNTGTKEGHLSGAWMMMMMIQHFTFKKQYTHSKQLGKTIHGNKCCAISRILRPLSKWNRMLNEQSWNPLPGLYKSSQEMLCNMQKHIWSTSLQNIKAAASFSRGIYLWRSLAAASKSAREALKKRKRFTGSNTRFRM